MRITHACADFLPRSLVVAQPPYQSFFKNP
jgi:hypothetical protein